MTTNLQDRLAEIIIPAYFMGCFAMGAVIALAVLS